MRRSFAILATLSALSLLPIAVHAEGADGGVDHFQSDQVRNFTQDATLAGGIKVSATVLALHKHQKEIDKVFSVAFGELRNVAEKFYAQDPNSEISRVNARAGSEPVKVSDDTIALLEVAKKAHQQSGGAFDIASTGTGNSDAIKLSSGANTVQFANPNLRLDVSSVVEGFLADRLVAYLWKANIDNAMVSVGNVTRSIGNDLVGPWRTVIADMSGRYAGRGMAISFSNASTATVTVGAKTPKPNERAGDKPAQTKCRSATVIAKDAATAQALATAIYQLGPDAGLALANRVPHVRAIIRDNAGNLVKSPGL
ncbi:MAG: FAD:protein FMN transferase [Deltaproteobacteria bacterium]|nr:FAD:protein FMN transferase [Deltaproteobacteria bacterium]